MLLALDMSTKNTGYAIFDEHDLIAYGCFSASSTDLIARIKKMISQLDEVVFQNYTIDKVIVEDVPLDKGRSNSTYKALMYLQGALVTYLHDLPKKLTAEFVFPNTWRSACGIKTGRTKRDALKPLDINFVKENYSLENVNDDEADAICIGYYAVSGTPNELNWE